MANELMVISNNTNISARKYLDMWAKEWLRYQIASRCQCQATFVALMAKLSEVKDN